MALKNRIYLNGLALSALWLVSCSPATDVPSTSLSAPVAEQRAYVVESPQGNRQDPYYWLRNDSRSAPDVIAYLEAENAYYDAYRANYANLTATIEEEILSRIKQ